MRVKENEWIGDKDGEREGENMGKMIAQNEFI